LCPADPVPVAEDLHGGDRPAVLFHPPQVVRERVVRSSFEEFPDVLPRLGAEVGDAFNISRRPRQVRLHRVSAPSS
jgi:hypothetical protein